MTADRRHSADSITDDALDALYAERDRLRATVVAVRELHRPVEGIGWTAPGEYGEVNPACSACGTSDEYAVRWPCATAAALPAPDTQETR